MTRARRKEAGDPASRIGWPAGFWRRTLFLWSLTAVPFFAAFENRPREWAPEQGGATNYEGEPADARPEGSGRAWEAAWDPTLWRVVIPDQNLVVRLNGLDPDAQADRYLPAARPYGVLRMAWAIWREIPFAVPKTALSVSLEVRREGQAEVPVATRGLAEHVRGMLLARHRLTASLGPVG